MDIKDIERNELLYREYANKCWNDLTATLWNNRGAFEFLPIVFVNHVLYDKNGDMIFGITYMHTNTATNVATIYPVVYISDVRTKEEIESTIRHEIIHYLLGIQYRCHDDCSALFWLICDCFDGNAYLPMNDKSKKIYIIAKPYIDQIFEMYKTTKNESVAINFSLMLTVIDDVEASLSPNFDKLKKDLEVCIEVAKTNCS